MHPTNQETKGQLLLEVSKQVEQLIQSLLLLRNAENKSDIYEGVKCARQVLHWARDAANS